jgi:hypothetical protein
VMGAINGGAEAAVETGAEETRSCTAVDCQ